MKLVKGNIEEYLYDLGVNKDFLDWRNKVTVVIEKN